MGNEENVFVRCLNRAFTADPDAIHALLCNRVPCNQALADDPTVIVDASVVSPGGFNVAFLGLLNGVLDEAGLPKVASRWGDPDAEGRRRLLGFQEYDPCPTTTTPPRAGWTRS